MNSLISSPGSGNDSFLCMIINQPSGLSMKDDYVTFIRENAMMRAFAEEAMKYGELPQPLSSQPRHVTVLLNPAASGGKGKGLYERYCAPLLHLAGIKVATVRTEHEGQAKDLMAIMENTSAVVVAGGDGTLSEVLTGLLRRSDQKEAVRRLPLGILPLGKSNSTTSAILGIKGSPKPRHLAEATMSIIHEIKRPMDVMEVTPLQSSDADGPPKPVYAASHLEWGAYRDARERNDVYWYWATLKRYMTYVFSSYKDISWDCSADVEYSKPCSGCSRCRAVVKVEEVKKPEAPQRWWMAYLPRTKTFVPEGKEEIDYSNIINEECGTMQKTSLSNVCDVAVFTKNNLETLDIPGHSLLLKMGSTDTGAFDFIKEGWSREWNKIKNYTSEISVGEITIQPTGDTKNEKGEEREFNIDSESFEVRPMKIKALPNAVTIFAPNPSTLSPA
ncbi:acylglycerol kinase, mitochondrial-like isoform X8 [Macrobrachium rosenbergii]|uniref:acylglycerol kinase, mitochondrial-like isoform X8 n=1 Tax=Macrobrachium rosenbergii TaxID=79674 RepID=UPI0034D44643